VTADRSARTGVTLRLRPPAVLRVYVVAFLLVWFGMLAVTTVNAGTSALPVVLAFVGVGGLLAVTTAPTFIPGWCRVDRDLTSLREWLDAGEPEGGPW